MDNLVYMKSDDHPQDSNCACERCQEGHRLRHQMLHRHLDELLADYVTHTGKLLSNTTAMELMQWSHKQTIKPEVKAL